MAFLIPTSWFEDNGKLSRASMYRVLSYFDAEYSASASFKSPHSYDRRTFSGSGRSKKDAKEECREKARRAKPWHEIIGEVRRISPYRLKYFPVTQEYVAYALFESDGSDETFKLSGNGNTRREAIKTCQKIANQTNDKGETIFPMDEHGNPLQEIRY